MANIFRPDGNSHISCATQRTYVTILIYCIRIRLCTFTAEFTVFFGIKHGLLLYHFQCDIGVHCDS